MQAENINNTETKIFEKNWNFSTYSVFTQNACNKMPTDKANEQEFSDLPGDVEIVIDLFLRVYLPVPG